MSVNNHVHLWGNVGADPRFVDLQSGKAMAVMRLATDESFRVDGAWTKRTEWHDVVVFGGLVEVVRKHVRKGTELSLFGSMRRNKWTDRAGQDRESVNVVVSELRVRRRPRSDEADDHTEADAAHGVTGAGEDVSEQAFDQALAEELAQGAAPAGEAA